MNPYIADILAQPSVVRDTIAGLGSGDVQRGVRELASGFRTGQYSRLVLTGMGASNAALNYLLFRLTPHGFCPLMVDTSELLYDAASVVNDATVLVIVSQSGQSAEIVKLLSMVGRIPIIAITNTADSPLGKAARFTYLTRAGSEHSVPCKTYLATLAAMVAFADDFTARPSAADFAALDKIATAMSAYLEGWEAKAHELADRLGGAKSLVVCGRGYSLCSVHCGAQAMREAAKIHAEGLSAAQFRHGHMEMIASGAAVLIYRGGESTAALQDKLADDIRAKGGTVVMIANQGAQGAALVPYTDMQTMPFLEILPAQLASAGLAWKQGFEPGVFTAHQKVSTIE